MHSRVITYQVKPGQIEERLRHAREGAAVLKQAPSPKGRVILVDPVSHKNMTIALFETEADMQAIGNSERHRPAFGRNEHASGEATRESFEVGHDEGGRGKYARVVTYHVKPGQMEARLRHQPEVVTPALKGVPGRAGVLILVDPVSHKNVTISFWDTEAAMRASEQAEAFQGAVAQRQYAAGGVTIERFAVGHSE
jgi:heme-degrading monooxygenase HmoA